MVSLILLAQLSGPPCGYTYGWEITPQNMPLTGCTVPTKGNPYGTRLRMDPYSPSGVRAEPAGPTTNPYDLPKR
jgi:hypothetical protein